MKMDRSFHGHGAASIQLALNLDASLSLFLSVSLSLFDFLWKKKLKVNLVSNGFHQWSLQGFPNAQEKQVLVTFCQGFSVHDSGISSSQSPSTRMPIGRLHCPRGERGLLACLYLSAKCLRCKVLHSTFLLQYRHQEARQESLPPNKGS